MKKLAVGIKKEDNMATDRGKDPGASHFQLSWSDVEGQEERRDGSLQVGLKETARAAYRAQLYLLLHFKVIFRNLNFTKRRLSLKNKETQTVVRWRHPLG